MAAPSIPETTTPLPLPALPLDLLSRTEEEAIRRVLLHTLERTAAAAERLADAADEEALHDFRVGMRRLRSQLTAFRDRVEDTVPRRIERRLRKAARATNRGRDAEVQAGALVDIVGEKGGQLSRSARAAAGFLATRMAEEREAERAAPIDRARRDFEAVRRALEKRLRIVHLQVDLVAAPREDAAGPTFGVLVAQLIENQLAKTRQRLAEARGIDPPDALHAARIAGKRLRYLLEPLREVDPEVGPLLAEMKALQDLLGDFHDACVLEQTVGEALIDQAKDRAASAIEATTASGLDSQASRRARRRPMPWALLELVALARGRQRAAWRQLVRSRAERERLWAHLESRLEEWRRPPS